MNQSVLNCVTMCHFLVEESCYDPLCNKRGRNSAQTCPPDPTSVRQRTSADTSTTKASAKDVLVWALMTKMAQKIQGQFENQSAKHLAICQKQSENKFATEAKFSWFLSICLGKSGRLYEHWMESQVRQMMTNAMSKSAALACKRVVQQLNTFHRCVQEECKKSEGLAVFCWILRLEDICCRRCGCSVAYHATSWERIMRSHAMYISKTSKTSPESF